MRDRGRGGLTEDPGDRVHIPAGLGAPRHPTLSPGRPAAAATRPQISKEKWADGRSPPQRQSTGATSTEVNRAATAGAIVPAFVLLVIGRKHAAQPKISIP